MNTEILLHIPHSSFYIPSEYKHLFLLNEQELFEEQLKMTDTYTDELFDMSFEKLVFPISRLVCDVERFRNENDEEMAKQGMWVCYTKTSNLSPLKIVNKKHKIEILTKYYDKHHKNLEGKVFDILKKRKCLIVDCHSFSSTLLPYEIHGTNNRPDICIGTDNFHTPKYLVDMLYKAFNESGYDVRINNPFPGTIVPLKYYKKNKNVMSIMIEINRKLYMNENNGLKNKNFSKIKSDICKIFTNLQLKI